MAHFLLIKSKVAVGAGISNLSFLKEGMSLHDGIGGSGWVT